MSEQGWISIHRRLENNFLWQDKPFAKGQAWIDLLLMVNHTPKDVLLGNEVIPVDVGETITSIRKLKERWGWSNTKVNNFFKLLEEQGMASKKSDSKKTVVKVHNYRKYQGKGKGENITKTSQEHRKNDTKASQKHTNNNVNNVNNDNKENNIPYAEIIKHLNNAADRNFKSTTKATRRKINGRWKEGFRLEDFKTVIDKKVNQWKDDEKMQKFIRPATLFQASKFEGYLNEQKKSTTKREAADF